MKIREDEKGLYAICNGQNHRPILESKHKKNDMGFDSSMTRTKTDAELRVIIKRIVQKHDLGLVAITRNSQGSVDVELDDGNNIFYADRDAIEEEIRTIKGAVINDIFLAGM